MSNTFKKVVVALTTAATVLSMTGIVFVAPVAAATTIIDGDVIRNPQAVGMAQFDAYIVKIVGSKKFKRIVLSPHVFESYGHLSWSKIKNVDQATMDAYTTSELVRADGDTKVYKLVPDGDTGTKEWLNMTAAEFTTQGNDWDSIYTINTTDRDAYNAGTEVTTGEETTTTTSTGTLTVTLAADTPAAGIAVENAARVPFTKVNLTATGGDVIVDSLIIQRTGTVAQDADISSLDIIDGDTNMPINITSKTFNSLHQATFTDDVTVKKGTTKSLTLAANMPASLDSYSGETPSLTLASIVLKGDAALNATLPITGNAMTLNSTITIGTATVQRGAYTNATSTSIQVGKTGYTFLSFQIQAGSTEKVKFNQVKIYQEGSASFGTDLVNIKLLKDGSKIADGVVNSSKYATFTFDSLMIDKGQIVQFQVQADVADGSARTIDLGIYKTTDLIVKGELYGYNITPTYSGTGASAESPVLSDNQFTISNGTLQVTRSNAVGAANIAVSNNQELGAFEFTCKGEAINVSQLVLTVTSTGNPGNGSDAILNVELVDPQGNVVAGPTDPVRSTGVVTLTDTFTIPVGTAIYKVRGDLQTSAAWASNDTVYVSFTPSAMTATGETTGNTITPSPSSAVSSNTQTVKAASLTVTRNTIPADDTIIVNQKDVTLSSWNFDATDTGEDVRVTSILWAGKGWSATNTASLTTFLDNNKNGKWDSGTDEALSPINDALAATATIGAASSTFAFDDPIIIKKGTSIHVALKGDKDSTAANGSEQWGLGSGTLSVVAYGLTTGNAIVEALTHDHGPTLTSAVKGALTIETKNNPSSAIVLAGSTGNIFTNVQLSAQYETLNLDQLIVYVGDGSYEFNAASGEYRDVTNVSIYDGTKLLAHASIPSTGYYTFNFSKGDVQVLTGATNAKVLTIKADMSTIDSVNDNAPGTNSADLKIGLGGTDGVKMTGAQSNSEITGSSYETYRSSSSSAMVLRTSKPIVTLPTASNSLGAATSLTNGNIPIYAFKVTADASGGSVLLYRATFNIATSGSDMTVTNVRVEDENGNTLKTASNPSYYANGGSYYYTATFNNPDFDVVGATTDEAIEITKGTSKTFYLYGTITGASAAENLSTFLVGDFASTSIHVNVENVANAGTGAVAGAGFYPTPTTDLTSVRSNFLWSDNYKQKSLQGVDGNNATSAAQWYNGHLVSGLGNKVSTTPYVISQ